MGCRIGLAGLVVDLHMSSCAGERLFAQGAWGGLGGMVRGRVASQPAVFGWGRLVKEFRGPQRSCYWMVLRAC